MAYNNIKIFGNQKVDYLIQTSSILSEEEIETTMDSKFMPDFNTFSSNINIMAPYTNDIVSSVISGLTEPLIGWQIYRRESNNSFLKKIADVDKDTLGIVDYLVSNQTNYEYYVIPATEKQLGIILKSASTKTCWWNWCLMSIKNISDNVFVPEEIWTFDNNLSSGDIVQNLDKTVYQNFTQYPKFSVGESNYIAGNISCLLGNVDQKMNTYNEPVETMKAWKKFCASGKDMILKDRKGNMYKVLISENSSNYLDESPIQPSTINFSFIECGKIDDITVYETGIIYDNGSFVNINISDSFYEYQQKTPSKFWEITHNLKKYPSVTIVDTSGNVIIGDVKYIDDRRVTISFEEEVVGNVYFN